MGSLTHLTIGAENLKAKPPRSKPPCFEPVRRGTNILSDPGAELHIANTGGGPNGNEIPYSDDFFSTHFLWPSDDSPAPESLSKFVDGGDGGTNDEPWTVSTSNPRTGTYHLRQPSDPTNSAASLILNELQLCSRPNYITWQTAIVSPGDFVALYWYATVSSVTGTPQCRGIFDMYDLSGSNLNGYNSDWFTMTTAYARYEFKMFMGDENSGAPYALRVAIGSGGTANRTFDIDDIVLEVTE